MRPGQHVAWTVHCSLCASHGSLGIQRPVKACTEETGPLTTWMIHCEASITCHQKRKLLEFRWSWASPFD